MSKLATLILTTNERSDFLRSITDELFKQCDVNGFFNMVDVTILNTGDSIGFKRNALLQNCKSEYTCFIDDDDAISKDYLKIIIDTLSDNPGIDCLSLRGIMTTDGHNPEVFEHSIQYNDWLTKPDAPCKYEQHSVKYSNWENDNSIRYDRSTSERLPIKYIRFPNHLNVIRADIAKQFKFPETNYGEDHAWSKALHESGLLKNEVYIDEVLYYYKYRSKK